MPEELEKVLNYTFKDKDILREALTHKSHSPGRRPAKDNERLEFLGDSVLGLAVAGYLYGKSAGDEGALSKIKSNLVSRHNLYFWAKELDLGKYLLLGPGEEATGGRERESILSNAMEAVLGAVYLDGGYEAASRIILAWLPTQDTARPTGDYKSLLQEYLQKRGKSAPEYEVASTIGPEHDKIFTVNVILAGEPVATGKGKNKKTAEQQAAHNALKHFGAAK